MLMLWCALVSIVVTVSGADCPTDTIAVYRMVFGMEWSEETFPKQYPKWRPPAHWATVVGRSHNATYRLWQLGTKASNETKVYVETGRTDLLNGIQQGHSGVFDVFYVEPNKSGVGQIDTTFFVDGNHSKVSLMSRIVPSPDWFVGVDSLELCGKDHFLDTMSIDVGPLDAGTDNGFTFTSPDWETVPRNPITRITAHHPNHPASSFYYPKMRKLPRLGYFQFQKLAEYQLRGGIISQHVREVFIPPKEPEQWKNTVYELGVQEEDFLKADLMQDATEAPEPTEPPARTTKIRLEEEPAQNVVEEGGKLDKVLKKKRKNKDRKRKHGPRPCRVGEWGEWSACSKTCGFGQATRTRKVIKHSKRGGRPCPPLQEEQWCGSARNCRRSGYFSWDG